MATVNARYRNESGPIHGEVATCNKLLVTGRPKKKKAHNARTISIAGAFENNINGFLNSVDDSTALSVVPATIEY